MPHPSYLIVSNGHHIVVTAPDVHSVIEFKEAHKRDNYAIYQLLTLSTFREVTPPVPAYTSHTETRRNPFTGHIYEVLVVDKEEDA